MPVRPLPPPPLGIPGGLYPGGPGGLYPGGPGGPGGPFPGFPGGDDSGNGSGSGSGAGFGVCGLTPGQVAALTPLLQKLGLADTGNEIKKLTKNIVYGLGGILGSESITHLLVSVDKIVDSLGLGGLDVKPAVDEVISILRNQVPCLLNTLLPLP
ncbi:hypothetical protein H4R19_000779 [Coemansia spiralis]|nr:hypothetical protein H4R19_000779 [Coemansia spiralis]